MNRPFDFLKFSRIAGAVAAAWLIGQGVAAQQKVPAGDPAKGQQIASQICGACHAADGNSTIATNPRLAGQSAEYLVKQLTDLAKPAGDKTGRENAVMSAFAMTLSDADRRNVSAWFSSQTPKASLARDKEVVELGARIYRTGIPEKAVPACAGCHGPTGAGLPVMYPRIGGQYAEYLVAELKAFREGSRRNNVPMQQIAFRMSDPEISAVTDFAAGLRSSSP
ncbi:MAG TPA: c-type cytochrome [Burkholderiaceae bacterium]|nr:c-type cytochrome [Burkholderiaceae bacterium]